MEQQDNSNLQGKQLCVSAYVMRSKDVSQKAKLVYAYLCSRYSEARKGDISRKEICGDLGIGQDTLGKALNQLENYKIIKRQEAKTTDRKYANNRYLISFDNDSPIPCDDVTDNEDVSLTTETVSDNNNIPISSDNILDNNNDIPISSVKVTDNNIPVSSVNAMDTYNNSITDVVDTDMDIVSDKSTTDNTDITLSVIDTIPMLSESVTDNNIPIPDNKVTDNKIVSIPSTDVTDSKDSTETILLF